MSKYQGKAKKSLSIFKNERKDLDSVEKQLGYVNTRDKILEDVIADIEGIHEDNQEVLKNISDFGKRLSNIEKKLEMIEKKEGDRGPTGLSLATKGMVR